MVSIAFAPSPAMTTTELERAPRSPRALFTGRPAAMRRNSLRLSWVVVTGQNGSRKLQMCWVPAAESLR
jgi:hypothetical protein